MTFYFRVDRGLTFYFRVDSGFQNYPTNWTLILNPTAESHHVCTYKVLVLCMAKTGGAPLHPQFRRPWKWKCPENTLVDWWKRIKSLFMKGNCYHVHFLEEMGACTQISMTTTVEFKGVKLVKSIHFKNPVARSSSQFDEPDLNKSQKSGPKTPPAPKVIPFGPRITIV